MSKQYAAYLSEYSFFKPFSHEPSFQPLRVRIVIAGAEGVGKSCIIKRFSIITLSIINKDHHYHHIVNDQ